MRTGRTQENTGLNVRARQRNDESDPYMRRGLPPSYNQTGSQYSNGQYNSTRPTAVGRLPPQSSGIRCDPLVTVLNVVPDVKLKLFVFVLHMMLICTTVYFQINKKYNFYSKI